MQNLTIEKLPEAVYQLDQKLGRIERLLIEQGRLKTNESTNQLLTVDQAAEFLNLAKPTVYSMVSRGELPYMKRSKRLYFSREDLMAYIRDGRKMTNEEIKDDAGRFITMRGKEVRHV